MAQEVLVRIAEIIEAEGNASQKIIDRILISYKGERDAIFDGVRDALASIPSGGTTADYEAGLVRIAEALHPSPEIADHYRKQAEAYLENPCMENEQVWEGYSDFRFRGPR